MKDPFKAGCLLALPPPVTLPVTRLHPCAFLFLLLLLLLQVPPDGEFALINYRTTHGFKPPFRLHTTVEPDPVTNNKALVTLRLWCEVRWRAEGLVMISGPAAPPAVPAC
jgi:hypothetical protein